jgi:hypothetical protein
VSLGLLASLPVRGDEELTDCTFENLQAAMAEGGTISLICDDTIVFASTITISKHTVLEGSGGSVILQGMLDETDSPQRLFHVNP